jgi:hypothetical protein
VVVRCSACFRPGHSRENKLVTFCQDIVNLVDEGVRTDAIIRDFSKEFDFVSHYSLLTNIAVS